MSWTKLRDERSFHVCESRLGTLWLHSPLPKGSQNAADHKGCTKVIRVNDAAIQPACAAIRCVDYFKRERGRARERSRGWPHQHQRMQGDGTTATTWTVIGYRWHWSVLLIQYITHHHLHFRSLWRTCFKLYSPTKVWLNWLIYIWICHDTVGLSLSPRWPPSLIFAPEEDPGQRSCSISSGDQCGICVLGDIDRCNSNHHIGNMVNVVWEAASPCQFRSVFEVESSSIGMTVLGSSLTGFVQDLYFLFHRWRWRVEERNTISLRIVRWCRW